MSSAIENEQKEIAESLRVRGPAAPVSRVSRKALLIVGGVLLAGLGGAVGWSTVDRPARRPPEPPTGASAGPPEAVSGLPKDYLHRGNPPILGPPLPGDLGRPILKAAKESEGEEAVTVPLKHPAEAMPAVPAAPRPGRALSGEQAEPLLSTIFPASTARAERNNEPKPVAAVEDSRLTSPERLQTPASQHILQAGTIVSAALITGLRSDAQGVALAQVTQDVHDSLGGGNLLIPAGARLIGEYAPVTGAGAQRLSVVWTRLILPSGKSIVLDKLPAADPQGMAGLQDGVDRHWRGLWGAAALSTIMSVGAEAGSADDSDLARALRRGTSQATGDVGQQFVGRSLDRAPTLTIRPGAPLRVILARDLVLEPYRQEVAR
ncbi:TrbI/VirB10 family protein [Caulobacter sp.]|uniref:TrbI/VirB10 family protein n=1 Tax=Caulobacter sp. TaxID=78 RepID=UPI0031DEAC4F